MNIYLVFIVSLWDRRSGEIKEKEYSFYFLNIKFLVVDKIVYIRL